MKRYYLHSLLMALLLVAVHFSTRGQELRLRKDTDRSDARPAAATPKGDRKAEQAARIKALKDAWYSKQQRSGSEVARWLSAVWIPMLKRCPGRYMLKQLTTMPAEGPSSAGTGS